jgi:hypothetical protein
MRHPDLDGPGGPQTQTATRPRLGSRGDVREALARTAGVMADAGRSAGARPASPALPDRGADAEDGQGADGRGAQAVLATRAQLRASVTAYVRRLRADGTTPQHAVVLVEEAVREALSASPRAPVARTLAEDVVRWTIEACEAA